MKHLFTLICTVTILSLASLLLAQESMVSPETETAALAGRWETVFNNIKADSAKVQDAVARMMMGHACLATQRNYGASKLFTTLESDEDNEQWFGYTRELFGQHPDNAVAQYLFADAQARMGDVDNAIAGFSHAIDLDKLMAIAYFMRGNMYDLVKKNYSNAIADYKSAVQINPRFARAYLSLGNVYRTMNKNNEALKNFGEAIKVDSTYAQAYYNRGNIYNDQGKFDEAILEFDQAIQLRPLWADAYYNRGNVYLFGKNELVNSIFEYDKAISINSSYVRALCNRGVARSRNGESAAAMADFTRVLQLKDDDAEAYSNRGNVYAQIGDFDKALNDYNRAIHFDPRLAEAYENRGVLYMVHLKQPDKACADWKKACELGRCANYNLAKKNGDCE